MTALLGSIVSALVGILFPGAPAWVGPFLSSVLPLLVDVVDDARELKLEGPERMAWVVRNTRKVVDNGFDDIPAWSALSEKRRDRILAGLAELVLFVGDLSSGDRRRVLRRLKRA